MSAPGHVGGGEGERETGETPARREERDAAARRSAERERDAAEASRDRFAFLAEVSRCLAASLDYETTLTTVAGMSLPYLGAWCIVDVCLEDNRIRRLAVLHPDPAKQALARTLHERYPPHPDDLLGAPRVIRTRRPEVVVEVSDAALSATSRDAEHLRLLRELGTGAYVIAPMIARDRMLGAITFVTAESGRRFGDIDVILAEDLAARAALAVDNARLHTEALRAREEAEADRAALRRQLAAAEEAERQRLARELHDQLGQHLTAFSLSLAEARRQLTAGQSADTRLGQLEDLARAMTREARYLALELRPPELDDVGLESALRTYVEQWSARYGVAAEVSVGGLAAESPLSREATTAAYRVMQEALTNVARHAAARQVSVFLEKTSDELRVIVEDDGRGFDPQATVQRVKLERRLGLAGMRERAALAGGTLELESSPGKGTSIYMRVPLPR